MTFTNDAVRELKDRILCYVRETLYKLLSMKNSTVNYEENEFITSLFSFDTSLSLDKSIAVLNSAILNFDYASIFTIHSFCNRIIKDYQLYLNIPTNLKLIKSKKEIIGELIHNFFRKKIITNSDLSGGIDKVHNNLVNLVKIAKDKDYISELIELFTKVKILCYKDGKFCLSYKILTKYDLKCLNGQVYDKKNLQTYNYLLSHLYSAICKYIEENYAKYYYINKQIDYDDLVHIVADGLINNNELSLKVLKDYPAIFIDEFQDTDYRQWMIFNSIYKPENGFSRGYFIAVGDPKQAIYRFREADVNVYITAKNIINNTLSLDKNRRSHADIINFLNKLFNDSYNLGCFGNEITYSSVDALVDNSKLVKLPEIADMKRLIKKHNISNYPISDARVQIITITGKSSEDKKQKLYNALASEILLLLNINPRLVQHIAILVTQNDEAREIVDMLDRYGVKASLFKRNNVFATNTALDLLKILKASIDISNLQLINLALATNLFNIPYIKLNSFIEDSLLIFGNYNIIDCFFRYKEKLFDTDVLSLIYLLIEDLNKIYLHYNKSSLPAREVANIIQLGELISKYCCNVSSEVELLFWFERKIDDTRNNIGLTSDIDNEDEELVRLDNDEERIRIITQHKAKGLEFEIVFCPYFKKNALGNISSLEYLHKNHSLKSNEIDFVQYHYLGTPKNILTYDNDELQLCYKEDNDEINRLNYVALTRAKSRLYIYLCEVAKNTEKNKYKGSVKPERIHELFGFNPTDINDTSCELFNYQALFSEPQNACYNSYLLNGVTVNSVDFSDDVPRCLGINRNNSTGIANYRVSEIAIPVEICKKFDIRLSRQSYTGILNQNKLTDDISDIFPGEVDDYSLQEISDLQPLIYKYRVLNEFRGANFGILIHSLCENYPLNEEIVDKLLLKVGIPLDYQQEVMAIIEEIFNYNIFLGTTLCLKDIKNSISELEFSFSIKNPVSIRTDIYSILVEHYGINHPYAKECKRLDLLQNGFLNGFIDLFFEYDGLYYVLDYKTNSLNEYNTCFSVDNMLNPLVLNCASNHYYLQYLLYLVALKRYLESKLEVDSAHKLLGGAIYFYVRGIFVGKDGGGILFDNRCQSVVEKLDCLFK